MASFVEADKTKLIKQAKKKVKKVKQKQDKTGLRSTREMLKQLQREGDDTRCIWN